MRTSGENVGELEVAI